MSDWAGRKRVELNSKLGSLRDDIGAWMRRSREGQPLEKHHSQVRRIAQDFVPALDRLGAAIAADEVMASWRRMERALQDLDSVWGYFRDKLIVRLLDDYASYLRAADDFAWACYLPPQAAAINAGSVGAAAVREPPLVCLSSAAGPFSLARGSSFAAELGARGLTTTASRTLARRLQVPVVAVPWFHVDHLPDMLIIGHEVGHHVERDLGLDGPARQAVGAALARTPPEARRSWPGWCSEAFCDAFGVLCGGAAFAAALADFLRVAGPPAAELNAAYPPTEVRLALCLAVLAETGSADEATALRDRWNDEDLVLAGCQDAFATAEIARALVATRYQVLGGGTLADVISFGSQRQRTAVADAHDLLAGMRAQTREIRVLMAAAAIAFGDDPDAYTERDVAAAVLRRAHEIREPGVRWRGGQPPAGDRMTAADAGLADELYELLTTADRASEGDGTP